MTARILDSENRVLVDIPPDQSQDDVNSEGNEVTIKGRQNAARIDEILRAGVLVTEFGINNPKIYHLQGERYVIAVADASPQNPSTISRIFDSLNPFH